jgi:hypothetical protein
MHWARDLTVLNEVYEVGREMLGLSNYEPTGDGAPASRYARTVNGREAATSGNLKRTGMLRLWIAGHGEAIDERLAGCAFARGHQVRGSRAGSR